MNEAVLASRVEQLERSVRRWRLATLVFAVLFLCTLATGGTLVTMLMIQLPEQQHMEVLMMQERDARQQAEAARQDAEEARRRLEVAKKNGENGP
jgi:hypothetical protein